MARGSRRPRRRGRTCRPGCRACAARRAGVHRARAGNAGALGPGRSGCAGRSRRGRSPGRAACGPRRARGRAAGPSSGGHAARGVLAASSCGRRGFIHRAEIRALRGCARLLAVAASYRRSAQPSNYAAVLRASAGLNIAFIAFPPAKLKRTKQSLVALYRRSGSCHGLWWPIITAQQKCSRQDHQL